VQLEDIGISAFHGKNVGKGNLGKLITAAERKQIPDSSFLLVESLDRITRQNPRQSLTLFLRILEAGITIVTLQPPVQEFPTKADENDQWRLFGALVAMCRAHDESVLKGQRVRDAWAAKQNVNAPKPMTEWCPAWLELSPDRSSYQIIERRAALVRQMFEDAVADFSNRKETQ
jgi:DNA invertase Pin-like site-specific DNA recombinase